MLVRAAENVIFRKVGDELVLLDYGRGIYYGLDPIGARIWELLAAGATTTAAVETLVDEYEVTHEQLEADVERLISELMERGLVVAA
ncbi:MAG TPA: PqqD family protein [Thermoanaerobaculia bacterium]